MAAFYRERGSRSGAADSREFPLAIRPAVEIIAKLSAERNRLRDELARLRDELRLAPQREELEALRRERDALSREVRELRARPAATGASGSEDLAALVARLERAVGRVERCGASSGPRTSAPASAPASEVPTGRMGSRPSSTRSTRSSSATPTTRIPGQRGPLSGMLGGLVKANIALRQPDAGAAKNSGHVAHGAHGHMSSTSTRPRGSSALLGLVAANKELRSAGLQRRRSA